MNIKELTWKETRSKRSNNSLFPRSIRGLIVGKSGCGKNNTTFEFLTEPWMARL